MNQTNIQVIKQESFNTVPWKNGMGSTSEIAIVKSSQPAGFDWRLSLATVANDGEFSRFPNVNRHLFLAQGAGITLCHQLNDSLSQDDLTALFDVAIFDGNSHTMGKLVDGAIKALNVMTAQGMFEVCYQCYVEQTTYKLEKGKLAANDVCLIYAANKEIDEKATFAIANEQGERFHVNRGDITIASQGAELTVAGSHFIVIYLHRSQ